MLAIIQHTTLPAWVQWLTAQDQLLLRHDAVYLVAQLANCPATLLLSNDDVMVRGVEVLTHAALLTAEQINQLLERSPLSLCQS